MIEPGTFKGSLFTAAIPTDRLQPRIRHKDLLWRFELSEYFLVGIATRVSGDGLCLAPMVNTDHRIVNNDHRNKEVEEATENDTSRAVCSQSGPTVSQHQTAHS